MYSVSFNENINGLYIKLTDFIDPEEVNDVATYIKYVARNNLTAGFTSVIDLTDVTVDRIKEHATEIRQALIVLSINKIGKIIRIGNANVLKEFSKLYDLYYSFKIDAPQITTCNSIEECINNYPELDLWFTTSICNVVLLS